MLYIGLQHLLKQGHMSFRKIRMLGPLFVFSPLGYSLEALRLFRRNLFKFVTASFTSVLVITSSNFFGGIFAMGGFILFKIYFTKILGYFF